MTDRFLSTFFGPRPLAIAHRGGSALRPENTLPAFAHALALGVDAVECDVHLSSDGEPVVIHDHTLDRTTNGRGPVAAHTAADLARLDAGHHFDAAGGFPWRGRGAGVPRLADLLDLSVTMPVIVEIKGDDPRVAGRAVDVVLAANAADRVVFAGFSHDVLGAVRARSASLATSASKDEVRAAVRRAYFRLAPRRPRYRVFQAPRRFGGRRVLTPALVGALGRIGVPVQAWIVDEASDMRELLAWGVRGLISDHPDRALAVIHERRS